MPTVPPTLVDLLGGGDSDLLTPDGSITGPTPDPDRDDVVLVSVDDGNALSQACPDQAPPLSSVKPRIDLGDLTLHSPSSIVGTPFDLSPRFEYPFPNGTCAQPLIQDSESMPSFSIFTSPPLYPSILPSLPPILSLPLPLPSASASKVRGEGRHFSPTHPKLNTRGPPIPPGLVKKRQLNTIPVVNPVPTASATDPSLHRARSGSLSSLTDKLERLEEVRGREAEKERAQSKDYRWKRNSLALCEIDPRALRHSPSKPKPDMKVRPLLRHENSSSPSLPLEVMHREQERRPPSAPPLNPPFPTV